MSAELHSVLIASPVPHWLAYRSWGDAENPRILFCVHGLTRNSGDFSRLAERLAGTYRVYAPDMPGRGASDSFLDPAHYSNNTYAEILLRLMDSLGIESADWVGTSMGGILGMMLAASQPRRIRRLVLNDIGSFIPAAGLRRIASYAGKRTRFDSRQEAESALRSAYAPFGLTEEADWQLLLSHSLKTLPDGATALAYDPAIVSGLINAEKIDDIDLSALWQSVSCPALILRGGESDILTRETAREMAARPGVRLVEFPGVGHAPSLFRDEEIAAVAEWLSAGG